jgi:hypothetical protein
MTSFQNKLKSLMAEYDLGIKSTEGLAGEELKEMSNNNEGMAQLFEAIEELHNEFLAAVPKKRAAATKPKTATKTKAKTDEEVYAATTEAETSSEEDKPKKKRAPAKKKEASAEAAAEPKAKSAKSAYSTFSPHITKGNKGELDGWDSIMVDVSFSKTTEASAALLESNKALSDLKDTKQSMATLLKVCKEALVQADGKVVIGKLSGIMWSAVGNVSPF